MMRARPIVRRGFTLIEVVIAIFVIGSTVALYAAGLKTFAVTRSAGHGEVALRIAEGKLEALRAAGYAAVPTSGSFSDPALGTLPSATGTLAVSDSNAKTKRVTVTVSWQESTTSPRSVSLSTLITQTGGL